jgi:hypothetical protein
VEKTLRGLNSEYNRLLDIWLAIDCFEEVLGSPLPTFEHEDVESIVMSSIARLNAVAHTTLGGSRFCLGGVRGFRQMVGSLTERDWNPKNCGQNSLRPLYGSGRAAKFDRDMSKIVYGSGDDRGASRQLR